MLGYVGKPRKDHFGPPSVTTTRLDAQFPAVLAEMNNLLIPKDPFFERLLEDWTTLFPELEQERPVRFENGMLFVRVANAPRSFALRGALMKVQRKLRTLPDAPKNIRVIPQIGV